MKLLKFNELDKQRAASIVFLAFTVVSISYYYRLGGTRDFGLYAKAGEAFLNGVNAYETQSWRSGSFGSSAIWVIFGLWPKALLPFLYQAITYISFWSFARYLGLPKNRMFWAFGFILFLSPVREVVNTLQITGLVLGLLSLSLASTPIFLIRFQKSYLIVQATALAIALDLKPHSIAFVLFLFFVKGYKRNLILLAGLIAVLGRSVLNIINGEFLEVAWLKGLLNLGNASGQNGESTSPLKLLDYLSGGEIETSILSMILILAVLLFAIVKVKSLEILQLIYLGLMASTLMTYMHYYDLAPLAICVLVQFFIRPHSYVSLATLMFLILPREIYEAQNLLVFVALLLLLNCVPPNRVEPLNARILSTLKASLIFGTLHFINGQANWDYRLIHSLVTSETMLLVFLVLLRVKDLQKNLGPDKTIAITKEIT